MMEMDVKYYNNAVKYLLPLYDENIIINNSNLSFTGAYTYNPHYPVPYKLSVTYMYTDKSIVENITFKYLYTKYYEGSNTVVFVLDPPTTFIKDWYYLYDKTYENVSHECRNKIMNAPYNRLYRSFIEESFTGCIPFRLKDHKKDYSPFFGKNEMLDIAA